MHNTHTKHTHHTTRSHTTHMTMLCYNKIPKSEIENQEKEISIEKWQQLRDSTTKGKATKEFFPKIKGRLNIMITLTPNRNGNGTRKN